jgi:gamma-glutamyltranspeptidase
MSLPDAVNAPRFHSQLIPELVFLENRSLPFITPPWTSGIRVGGIEISKEALESRGHTVSTVNYDSHSMLA